MENDLEDKKVGPDKLQINSSITYLELMMPITFYMNGGQMIII